AIDQDVEARLGILRLRHPEIDRACRLTPLSLHTGSPEFQRGDFLFDESGGCGVTVAYICLDGDPKSLAAALAVHRRLRRCGHRVPIIVRVTEGSGLARLLSGDGGDFDNLHPFPLLEKTCRPEHLLRGINEIIARAIHEDYLRSELARQGVELGDRPSLVPWDELSEDYREANRHQASHVTERLEALGYQIVPLTDWGAAHFQFPPHEVEAMAQQEHGRWCAERRRIGWRYGAVRDDEARRHPDLLPWNELSEEAQEKDRVLVRDLPAFLAKVGFAVERRPDADSGP
ncbi:MAG: RyR domain-containing protein, partial [Planctomycetota bacterium]